MLNQPTPEEITRALELLEPERLLMVRKDLDELDDTMKAELRGRVQRTMFPVEWADRLQSILLLLHETRAKDSGGFISRVFLPWVKFRRTLLPSRRRIGHEMARIGEIPEGGTEETDHFIAVYRSVVSDLLDPYITLLVACHEFISGTFGNFETANFKMGEFNKVEFVQSAMRKRGDTADLFRGYNSRVRNAISHAGSHGFRIEGRTVLFRDIRRGPEPIVSLVRWSVDELGWNGILMAELLDCIDVATEIFGLDCVNVDDVDFPIFLQVVDAAFTPSQRADIRAESQRHSEKVWNDQKISDKRRREILAEIAAEQFRARGMASRGLDLSAGERTVLIAVPDEGALNGQQALRGRLAELTRYLIVARAVFGPWGEKIVVMETDDKMERHRLLAAVPNNLLDDYGNERAGLIDLLKGGLFHLGRDRIEVTIDENALADAEDRSLGRAFVRQGRLSASDPD